MANQDRKPLQNSFTGHRGAEAQVRVKRMVSTAHRLFITRGYHQTSLDAILKRSGGSKATLRKYFGNKAGLLGVVLNDEARRCVARADRAVGRCAPSKRAMEEALLAFASVVLQFYCRRDSLRVYRAVIAESAHQPDVGRRFYRGGHMSFVAALAKHLSRWQELGLLMSTDVTISAIDSAHAHTRAHADADRFLHMLRAGPHDQALLGVLDKVSAAAIRDQVRACVRIFCNGLVA